MTEFEQHCKENRTRIRGLPLDQQYSQTVEYQGRVYHYDPDYDCFYPYVDPATLSHWDRWAWVYTIVGLAIVCWLTM